MIKKEGSIKTRKDGRVELRISTDGIKKSFYGKTEAEARRNYRNFKNSLENEKIKYSDMTVSNYINNWLKTFKFGVIKDSSFDRMESIFKVHIEDSLIGKMKMRDVRTEDIQGFINTKGETLSYSSIKKIYELFSPSFKHAFNQEDIGKNPMLLVVMPRQKSMNIKTKKIDMYSDNEISSLIDACDYDLFVSRRKRYRYAPLFLFIINTGLRIGECIALEWSDIDFDNKLLHINKSMATVKNRGRYDKKTVQIQTISSTKTTNSERIIPLNSTALKTLNELRYRNDELNINSKNLLCNYNGELLSLRSIERTFESICKDFNICHRGVHALRHTFGSLMIRKGIDIKIVSELLGHADVSLTYNKYIHIIKEQKAKAIDMIDITSNLGSGSKVGQSKMVG